MWKKLEDCDVRGIWVCRNEDCFEQERAVVGPGFYEENGTPVCSECSRDMAYQHTEVDLPADLEQDYAEYTGASQAQVSWGNCADPRGVLTLGASYEIEREEVHSSHTKLFLADYPGKGFPSAAFKFS